MRVLLFARARELAQSDVVDVAMPCGATVVELRQQLAKQYPCLAGIVQRSTIAVDNEYADENLPLPMVGDIALIPPVSGGGI